MRSRAGRSCTLLTVIFITSMNGSEMSTDGSIIYSVRSIKGGVTSIESEWFEKGRNSILRQNRSGCCCKFNEEDTEIVSVCEAHKELINTKIAKLKAENTRLLLDNADKIKEIVIRNKEIQELEAKNERFKNLLIRTKNVLASDGLDKIFIALYYEIEEALEER